LEFSVTYLCLAALGPIWVLSATKAVTPNGVAITLLRSVDHLFEAKWGLSGSLPHRPMLEKGIDIPGMNVMVLSESNACWQILI